MANTGWINSLSMRNLDNCKNIGSNKFDATDMGRNGGSGEVVIDIDDALIKYGTIEWVYIKYSAKGARSNSTYAKATARSGWMYSGSDANGSYNWYVKHTKDVPRSGDNPKEYTDTLYPVRSTDGKYYLLLGAVNNIALLTLTVYFTNISIAIEYTPRYHTISTGANNDAYGNVAGGGSKPYDTATRLTAQPYAGYHFVNWNDGNTEVDRYVPVLGDATYIANFAPNTYYISFDANGGSGYMPPQTFKYGESQPLLMSQYNKPFTIKYYDDSTLIKEETYECRFGYWKYNNDVYLEGADILNLTTENNATLTFTANYSKGSVLFPEYSKDGYSLLAWQNAAGYAYAPGEGVSLDADDSYFAVWIKTKIEEVYGGNIKAAVYVGNEECQVYVGNVKIYG